MSKESWVILLGIAVAIMPFFGFPGSWKTVFYIFLGLAVAVLATLLQIRKSRDTRSALSENGRRTDSYVENGLKRSNEEESQRNTGE